VEVSPKKIAFSDFFQTASLNASVRTGIDFFVSATKALVEVAETGVETCAADLNDTIVSVGKDVLKAVEANTAVLTELARVVDTNTDNITGSWWR
jgi:hypothetical protein